VLCLVAGIRLAAAVWVAVGLADGTDFPFRAGFWPLVLADAAVQSALLVGVAALVNLAERYVERGAGHTP